MNQVTKADGEAFKAQMIAQRGNFAAALPSHIPPEKFERVVLMAVQRDRNLLVPTTDKQSLFLACQRAAADGLLPDGREGALVIFKGRVQWMPMVAGLMKLARNSGEIASINAHVAYKGEKFSVILGDDERIEHERDLSIADGAQVVAVYAVAKLRNGETVREVMTKAQVEKVRAVSRTRNGGPWDDWWEEMAKKTVIRRLSKRLPLSTDRDADLRLQSAAEREDADMSFSGVTLEGEAGPSDPFEAAAKGIAPTMEGGGIPATPAPLPDTTPPAAKETKSEPMPKGGNEAQRRQLQQFADDLDAATVAAAYEAVNGHPAFKEAMDWTMQHAVNLHAWLVSKQSAAFSRCMRPGDDA